MNSKESILEVFQRKYTMYEPKTINQAIKPMLLLNLITGLGVFKHSNNRLTKCLEFIYSGFYVSFLIYTCYYTTEYFNNIQATADYFLNRELFLGSYFSNGLALSVLVVVARIRAKKVRTVIALCDEYDRTMEKMGLPKHNHSIYWFQLYTFGIGILIIVIYSTISICITETTLLESLLCEFRFNFPLVIINVCNMSFCVWIRYLRLKFEQLNDLLRNIRLKKSDLLLEKKSLKIIDFDNKMNPFEHEDIRRNKGNAITISIVKRSHLELIKIADVTSTTYGLQLLLLMFTTYIFLTSLFYASYRIIWLNSTTEEILRQMVVPTSMIIFFGFQVFVISQNCGKANNEAVVTGEIICKLYGTYTCKIFRAEIRNFTLQLVQNPLTFTVCGFFILDYSFILKVIQSISTYLVILIQVGDTVIQSVRTLNNKNYQVL